MLTNIVKPKTRRQHGRDLMQEAGHQLPGSTVREAGKHALALGAGPADLPLSGETYSKATHLGEDGLLRGGIPHNRRGRMPHARVGGAGAPPVAAPTVAPMPDPSSIGSMPDGVGPAGPVAPGDAGIGASPMGGGFKRGGRIK